ncbi:MAG: hypothetical protein ACREC6_12215 [Hyphomicrobiaceae bacterium]
MSAHASRTARIDPAAQSSLDHEVFGEFGLSVSGMAANDDEKAQIRIVKRYRSSIGQPPEERSGTGALEAAGQHRRSPTDGANPERMLPNVPVVAVRHSPATASFHALQEWEGYVTGIGPETFTADLVDVTAASKQAEEQVELPLEELGHRQRAELKVGSVFRWAIGYETTPAGQRRRVSQLVFRQLPRWTQADINAANQLAHLRHRQIKWE